MALGVAVVLWIVTGWHTPARRTIRYSSDSVSMLAFTPAGDLLVTESNSGLSAPINDPQAYVLAISPDGKWLATGGRDGVVRVWDAASDQLVRTFVQSPAGSTVDLLQFSPNGQMLAAAAGDRKKINVWQVADGQIVVTIADNATSVAFSPDGQEIVLDGDAVRVFHVVDGREVRQITARGQVMLSPDGRLLAVRGYDDNDRGLRIFRYQDGALLKHFRGSADRSYYAAFSPDGQYLATVDVPHGGGANFGVGSISLGSDFLTPTVPIKLWRTRDWLPTQTFAGHRGGAHALTFSPDGRQLASAGDDVRLWRVAPRHPVWLLLGPFSVAMVVVGGIAWWVWSRR
jgi:WD40 repeat protein